MTPLPVARFDGDDCRALSASPLDPPSPSDEQTFAYTLTRCLPPPANAVAVRRGPTDYRGVTGRGAPEEEAPPLKSPAPTSAKGTAPQSNDSTPADQPPHPPPPAIPPRKGAVQRLRSTLPRSTSVVLTAPLVDRRTRSSLSRPCLGGCSSSPWSSPSFCGGSCGR